MGLHFSLCSLQFHISRVCQNATPKTFTSQPGGICCWVSEGLITGKNQWIEPKYKPVKPLAPCILISWTNYSIKDNPTHYCTDERSYINVGFLSFFIKFYKAEQKKKRKIYERSPWDLSGPNRHANHCTPGKLWGNPAKPLE